MKRRKVVLGASLVGITVAATLGFSSSAFAAGIQPGPGVSVVPLAAPQAVAQPDLKFLRTTKWQAVPKPAAGIESIGPQRDVSKPVPKGNPGDAPYVAPAYATVPSLPISNFHPQLRKTGVTGFEQATFGGYSLEPPDTEICASPNFILQTVNNQLEVYDAQGHELSAPIPAEFFFSEFIFSVFDPKCYWDPDTQKWFVTWAVGDFFTGSFTGVYIAVSQTSSPLGTWNIYFLDTSDAFGNPGCLFDSGVACLGDQPLLGADKWTLQISINEFPLIGGFNGAGYFLIDKTALALGLPFPNVVAFNLGMDVTTPDGDCPSDGSGAPCWYSVQPAESSNMNYALSQNGSAFAMSALDFFGANDDRIALWGFFNTRTISSVSPAIAGDVVILPVGSYGMPPFAVQPEGPNPLGEDIGVPNVREIQTNDDRMNEVDFNSRTGWLTAGLNTGANVGGHHGSNFRAAIEWFGIRLHPIPSGFAVVQQKNGYIANAHADTIFPASTTSNTGNGIWVYSLTGDNIYPSAAFSTFSNHGNPTRILISHNGAGPQDGFTEYCPELGCGGHRPRWGDYSGAVTTGNTHYWATEFIGNSCTLAEYNATGGFCNGERGPFINWDNSIAGHVIP